MSSDESMCAGEQIIAGSCGNASMKSVCVCDVGESEEPADRDTEKQAIPQAKAIFESPGGKEMKSEQRVS